MASKSKQGSNADRPSDEQSGRSGLPFEPKAKATKAAAQSSTKSSGRSAASAKAQAKADEIRASRRQQSPQKSSKKATSANRANRADDTAIPPEVSRRMVRRMAFFSGSPIALGVGIFFLAYYLLSHQIVELPTVAVLLVTMGCFGLGVVGLTYGMLSASWDEAPGSLIGLSEFKLNLGRAIETWRASKASKT